MTSIPRTCETAALLIEFEQHNREKAKARTDDLAVGYFHAAAEFVAALNRHANECEVCIAASEPERAA